MTALTKNITRIINFTVRHRLLTTQSALIVSGTNDRILENVYDEEDKYITEKDALSPVVDEDLSEITPHFPPTFNVAAYVNKSEDLQKLVALNVNFSKLEKKPHLIHKLLKLDFEKDIKKYIFFLKDYVQEDNIGKHLTKNPGILHQSLEDLQIRINYLRSKNFSKVQVARIIDDNPFWLSFSTVRIDRRLGYFQSKFGLTGNELRTLATMSPKLITYSLHHINTNSFVILEEMGFKEDEVKSLLLQRPKIWVKNQLSLLRTFSYVHNTMKIPHETILKYPGILLSREFRIRQRHIFLKQLNRDQFDNKKENYVPLIALAEGTDVEFCKTYAKCTVDDYNLFLKTM